MNFSYLSRGSLAVFGCALNKLHYDPTWNSKFVVGDVVYFKKAALKGKIEKILVYSINRYLVYEDPLHALYNENELVTFEEALALIRQYNDRYNASQEFKAKNC